jgi:hypothetical protein
MAGGGWLGPWAGSGTGRPGWGVPGWSGGIGIWARRASGPLSSGMVIPHI